MESGFCIECKTETDWVMDYQAGDTICRECGLILDCHYIQNTPEWRIFDDDDKGADPTRVGLPSDPLTGEPSATRIISANGKNKKNADQLSVPKKFEAPSAKEKNLKEAYIQIERMAEMLGIVKSIVEEAKLFYQKAYDENLCQGKKSDKLTALAATCLVLACQSNGQNGARTIKEIRRVSNGCSKHDINNMKILLQEKLSVKAKTVTAADLATRCCSKLGMSHDQKRAVLEALPNAEQVIVRSSTPAAVLAAVVYMISQHSDRKLTIREVREAAVIGDNAAKATYKEISAKASMIVPDWFRVKFSGPRQICTPSI